MPCFAPLAYAIIAAQNQSPIAHGKGKKLGGSKMENKKQATHEANNKGAERSSLARIVVSSILFLTISTYVVVSLYSSNMYSLTGNIFVNIAASIFSGVGFTFFCVYFIYGTKFTKE